MIHLIRQDFIKIYLFYMIADRIWPTMHGPTEILERIFFFLEHPTKRLSPKSTLLEVALVCRKWSHISQHLLFRSIAFTSSAPKVRFENEFVGSSHAQLLKQVLLIQNDLASFVQHLCIVSEDSELAESTCLVDIIRLCPNLRHIEVRGYNGESLPALKQALMEKDLVSLIISSYGTSIALCKSFCTKAELYEMMVHWPNLEKIQFFRGSVENAKEAVSIPNVLKNPRLRELRMARDIPLTANDLRFLLSTTPALEIFIACVASDTNSYATLQKCVTEWSSSLEHLELYKEPLMDEPLKLVLYAPSLRNLHASANVVDATTITGLPSLEHLTYRVSAADDIEALVHVFHGSENRFTQRQSKLRKLIIWPSEDLVLRMRFSMSDIAIRKLREFCQARNVDLDYRMIRGYIKA